MQNLYRLALTENGLETGFLHSYRLPAPRCDYKDHSAKFPKGAGGQSIQGFENVTLQWINITPLQAFRVRKLVDDALAGDGVLYATIYKASGQLPTWVDISAVPHYPEAVINQGQLNGLVLVSFTLFLNDVTTINAVSTVLD